MNQRLIDLYRQAVTFAYNTAGDDAGRGTIIESLTAGKFAELIVRECTEVSINNGCGDFVDIEQKLFEHFGVEP